MATQCAPVTTTPTEARPSTGELSVPLSSTSPLACCVATRAQAERRSICLRFYLLTTVHGPGKPLDGAKTYRLDVPANAPAKEFWVSHLLQHAHALLPGHGEVRPLLEGRLADRRGRLHGLHLAPTPPHGKASNWLATRADERFVGCARFYGASDALANRPWTLGDFEEMK
jgi:hypothetical protein